MRYILERAVIAFAVVNNKNNTVSWCHLVVKDKTESMHVSISYFFCGWLWYLPLCCFVPERGTEGVVPFQPCTSFPALYLISSNEKPRQSTQDHFFFQSLYPFLEFYTVAFLPDSSKCTSPQLIPQGKRREINCELKDINDDKTSCTYITHLTITKNFEQ